MKFRKRNNRKNVRVSTERRLGSETLEGRILMAADMGWWSVDNQSDEQAEETTDTDSTKKTTRAVKHKKEQISLYGKKQAAQLSRHAEHPTVSLPKKLQLKPAEHLELHSPERLESQEMKHLGVDFEEIAASKGTSEFDKLLEDVGISRNRVLGNDLFGDLEAKMTEKTGSLEARLESLVSSPKGSTSLADARGALDQARGMASQPTTDANGNTWFETKSADGKKSVLITPDRKLPGETGNGGTIIVVQHTDEGTTITWMSNHNGKVKKTTVKCDDNGCAGVDPNASNNTNNSNQDTKTTPCTDEDDPNCSPANPGRPAPDDTGSGTPLPASLVREAWAKFDAEHGRQPWNANAGQPVPESDGDVAINPAAASQLFNELARNKWNPMIVQPGPDGDNEQDYLAMEEPSSNLAFIKLEMAGQPVPDDPDWGDNAQPEEGVSGGSFNPQPVTTQAPTPADEANEEEEVPEQEH